MTAVHLAAIAYGVHPIKAAGYSALTWSFLRLYHSVDRKFEDLPLNRAVEVLYTTLAIVTAWGFLV